MKQVSKSVIWKILNARENYESEMWIQASCWITEFSGQIARANMPNSAPFEKNYCGDWPKGWRKAMLDGAKAQLIERYIKRECREIDGVIWTGNLGDIEMLEKRN